MVDRGALVASIGQLERALRAHAISPLRMVSGGRRRQVAAMKSWDDAFRVLGIDAWYKAEPTMAESRLHMASKLLTYPLTIARFADSIGLGGKERETCRIAIVGARAESSLPPLYWQQLALLLESKIEIIFVGPHAVLPVGKAEKLSQDYYSTFSSRNLLFHQVAFAKGEKGLGEVDAVVLFNSGIGHPKEKHGWQPTLSALRDLKKSILFTSFNMTDLERDLMMARTAGFSLQHVVNPNPFRSLNREFFEEEEISTNASAFIC